MRKQDREETQRLAAEWAQRIQKTLDMLKSVQSRLEAMGDAETNDLLQGHLSEGKEMRDAWMQVAVGGISRLASRDRALDVTSQLERASSQWVERSLRLVRAITDFLREAVAKKTKKLDRVREHKGQAVEWAQLILARQAALEAIAANANADVARLASNQIRAGSQILDGMTSGAADALRALDADAAISMIEQGAESASAWVGGADWIVEHGSVRT